MQLALWITSTIVILALLGGLSASTALGLHLLRPKWSRGRRIFTAAGFAAFLPMSVAFAGLFLEGGVDDGSEMALAVLALTVLTLVLALLCLPAAWMLTRHTEAKDASPAQLPDEAAEPTLIAADG